MKSNEEITLTESQQAELLRLKSYCPYRIVYGAIKGEDWICGAVHNMRQPNQLAREGYTVFKLQ